jgi:CRP-like cAMP-binding protein
MGPTREPRADLRRERIQSALRSLPVFKGLGAEDHLRLEGVARLRDLRKGDALWHAGDSSDALTVIVSGRIKVVRHGAGGDVILDLFEPGEQVGGVAVYAGIPYPASAIAMEHSALLQLPRAEYFDLLERHPGFARGIIRELTRLNLALTRKLAEMRGQRVETRIARLFLTLADRIGRPATDGLELPLTLTRQEVAEMVGTTVESAIRVLSRWGREGLLLTGEGRFVIPDRAALEAVTREGEAAGQEP